jgi:hypothetical protein
LKPTVHTTSRVSYACPLGLDNRLQLAEYGARRLQLFTILSISAGRLVPWVTGATTIR